MTSALLSSAYFPPIQWFQKLRRYDKCLVERYDSYAKQTYRNRCVIATANGTQPLTVPVEHYEGDKCLMRDIRISSHGNWQRLHWHALMSAYGESPFFDYYADDLHPFFEKPHTFLFDHNLAIVETLCQLLDIDFNATPTSSFHAPKETVPTPEKGSSATPNEPFHDAWANTLAINGIDVDDLRDAIRPKKPLADPTFEPKLYYQVYADKIGFLPNLSILDLLFNEGPEAVLYL